MKVQVKASKVALLWLENTSDAF